MENTEGKNVYLNDLHLQPHLSSTLSIFVPLHHTLHLGVTCHLDINIVADKL